MIKRSRLPPCLSLSLARSLSLSITYTHLTLVCLILECILVLALNYKYLFTQVLLIIDQFCLSKMNSIMHSRAVFCDHMCCRYSWLWPLVLRFISFTVPLNVKYFINIHILRLTPCFETVSHLVIGPPFQGGALLFYQLLIFFIFLNTFSSFSFLVTKPVPPMYPTISLRAKLRNKNFIANNCFTVTVLHTSIKNLNMKWWEEDMDKTIVKINREREGRKKVVLFC